MLPVPFRIILAVIVLLQLFIGMFMEAIAGIILLAPILVPVVTAMGMNPVHFGIVMILFVVTYVPQITMLLPKWLG